MQSTYLSRSLFGCTRISLISVAVLVGTMVLPAKGTAQQTGISQQSASIPESPGMAEHAGMPTSLRELIQEAEEKNPQIAASFHTWQASRNVPKQASALPETQFSVQQFSVGSPRPFAGYSNSDFAYIGFGASQDIPYPGNRRLRARVAEHEADSMEAQTSSIRRSRTLAAGSGPESGCALKAGLYSAAGHPSRAGAQRVSPGLQCGLHIRAHRESIQGLLHGEL